MKRIVILGAGTFAEEVADLAGDCGLDVAFFAVDRPPWGFSLCGVHVHNTADIVWEHLNRETGVVAAIVSPEREKLILKIWSSVPASHSLEALVHPSASVSRVASILTGTILSRLVAVSRGARIGPHAIVNRGATVGHHAMICEFATIGPGATLCGNVRVGRGATVGAGATILEGREIGERAVVGAGAVVTQDVPPGEDWRGVPARRWICG